jgi:hypothetical protein
MNEEQRAALQTSQEINRAIRGFKETREGKVWTEAIRTRTRQIFDSRRKDAQESLGDFRNLAKGCIVSLPGIVIGQDQFPYQEISSMLFPIYDPEKMSKEYSVRTALILSGCTTRFMFPGPLPILTGKNINLTYFSGKSSAFEYAGEDRFHYNPSGKRAHDGLEVPLLWTPEEAGRVVNVMRIRESSHGAYSAHAIDPDFGLRDLENLARTRVLQDKSLMGLEIACQEAAAKELPPENYGFEYSPKN